MPTQKSNTTGAFLIQQVVEDLERDFNFISLDLLEKAYTRHELSQSVIYTKHYVEKRITLYPCFKVVYEARNDFLNDKLKEKVNELDEIGIYLMEVPVVTRVMIFFIGCGYDFYEAHWIPLYRDVLK